MRKGNTFDRLPALANELARLQVDIIVAGGLNDSLAAKKATTIDSHSFFGLPWLILLHLDLVDSLARPGGNITGFTDHRAGLLAGKRLDYSRTPFPNSLASQCYGIPGSRD